LADLACCFLFLFTWPVSVLKGGSLTTLWRNFGQVLIGKKTWIGLAHNHLKDYGLKDAIVRMDRLTVKNQPNAIVQTLDKMYIDDYHPEMDIWTFLKTLDKVGG
jgi:hypothetical protein